MSAPIVSADTVQDVVFGFAFLIAGIDIISSAVKKALPSALASVIAAISAYGALYL